MENYQHPQNALFGHKGAVEAAIRIELLTDQQLEAIARAPEARGQTFAHQHARELERYCKQGLLTAGESNHR